MRHFVIVSLLGLALLAGLAHAQTRGHRGTGRDVVPPGDAPTVESGFPICWTNNGSTDMSHQFTFSTAAGGRYFVLGTSWYTGSPTNSDPYPITMTSGNGAPTFTIAGGTVGHDTSDHWTAQVWTAYSASTVTNGTVTVTSSKSGSDIADGTSCLWSFVGAAGFGAVVDHHSAETDPGFTTNFVNTDATITVTAANSLVVGVGASGELCLDGYNISTPLTALANTTLDAQRASTSNAGGFAFHKTTATTGSGAITLGLARTQEPSGNTVPDSWADTQMSRAYSVEAIEVLAP